MDLNLVSVFVRVVQTGSFTAAGHALGLPKSSVSRMVARLEDELGVRLLQRTTRALTLTDIGRGFYERARGALGSLEEAATLATDARSEPRGVVRLTAPIGVGSAELAEVLARFHELHREIHVEVSLTDRFVDLVEEGFDLAIRAGRLDDSSLVARKVGSTDFMLYASPAYVERRGVPTTLEALREHDCVLFRGREGRAEWRLVGASAEEERIEVQGVASAHELGFVRHMVVAGMGIGLLPRVVQAECAKQGRGGSLVRVLPEYAMEGGPLHVVSPRLELAPRRVTLLRDHLVAELTRLYSPQPE